MLHIIPFSQYEIIGSMMAVGHSKTVVSYLSKKCIVRLYGLFSLGQLNRVAFVFTEVASKFMTIEAGPCPFQ